MSEEILKALVQLFALIAFPDKDNDFRREIVKNYLISQLNAQTAEEYFRLYEEYYLIHVTKLKKLHQKEILKPSLAANSVKALRIASDINKELTYFQKLIVIIRLLEFLKTGVEISHYERDFVHTISQSFNIEDSEYELLEDFVIGNNEKPIDSSHLLQINDKKHSPLKNVRHVYSSAFKEEIQILNIQSGNLYLLRFIGQAELSINGQIINADRIHVLTPGCSIRNQKLDPIYYSDIVSKFNSDNINTPIVFKAQQVKYYYSKKENGIHPLSFKSESGKLVGIMGASGAGKSTLINILSGINKPDGGKVTINGRDIHTQSEAINGLIGYVSQDDLLMEELTVYQNLYYNAKLCFDEDSEFQIKKKVLAILKSLGLYETRHMIVGNPLNKKISGGQRKRLNIALELLREPSVLFLDEPTSGLSSRDSENILDLLKELTLKGKLVFVVIHQPSSDIFKMFNQLLVIDTGGYLIYDGDPVEGINYFKSHLHMANRQESECTTCGNVNPEQILNIIESQVIDEYGNPTSKRKTEPIEWYKSFKKKHKFSKAEDSVKDLPSISFKIPNKFKQLLVFIKRDVLSKISNKQYLLINLLETPFLALILSTIIKYHNVDAESNNNYIFQDNPNVIIYIIMAVIIAIFVGLTVSAEEIISDRKIRKREAFLNLSRFSYLLSKVIILILLSAIQTFLFVAIGNYIIQLKGMFWQYWLVLFSASIFANLLGLNISDSFKSAINIYITIPFLVIPQIILSGVFISYDSLNPKFSNPESVPWYGELITAKWAFEALTVNQFINNKYEKNFYAYDKIKSQAHYRKEYWVPALQTKLTKVHKAFNFNKNDSVLRHSLNLLQSEIKQEALLYHIPEADTLLEKLTPAKYDNTVFSEVNKYLQERKLFYVRYFNNADEELDKTKKEIIASSTMDFNALKRNYHNVELELFVKNNKNIFSNKIIEYDNRLVQKIDPVFKDPESPFLKAHFLSPYKKIGSFLIDTFWANVLVIWLFNLLLFVTLYFGFVNQLNLFFKRLLKK